MSQPNPAPDVGAKYAVIIIVVLVAIVVLTKIGTLSSGRGECTSATQLRQVAQKATHLFYTAKQDQNPLLAVTHAATSLAMLQTITDLFPSRHLAKKMDLDVYQLRTNIEEFQRLKIIELHALCPALGRESV
jgi:hypothetical protein